MRLRNSTKETLDEIRAYSNGKLDYIFINPGESPDQDVRDALYQELTNKGYTFKSDTDTEVLLNFIQDIQDNNKSTLEEALRIALKRIVGAYCILLIDQDDPETIIAARKGSPLVIGIGKGEHFLASDASPIIEYTKEVVYVNDYEIAIVKAD